MEITLNINKDGYIDYLDKDIDSFIISLKKYSMGEEYTLNIEEMQEAINTIKRSKKNIYVNINYIPDEDQLNDFKKDFENILKLDADAFVVSDFGILNMFKKNNILDRVIFSPQTYICNMHTAEFFSKMNIKKMVLSNELSVEEISKISEKIQDGVEILYSGYHIMTISKRNILDSYFKYHNIKRNGNLFYLKEETRDILLPAFEDDYGLYVYTNDCIKLDKNIFNSNIKHIIINSFLRNKEDILNDVKEVRSICKE